jgi:TatD DNase family protein
MNPFVDSHCHIGASNFAEDADAVVERALAQGLTHLIHIGAGANISACREAIEVVERHPQVFCTLGVHPHDVGEGFDPGPVIEEIRHLASHEKVVGIGETGLDYYYDHAPKEAQKRGLRQFLMLAQELDQPVVFHVREAYDDFFPIIDEVGLPAAGGVLHCFTGTLAEAEGGLERGLYVSMSGIVTFKNAGDLRAVAQQVPLDRLLVETDCPYLAPVPKRGRRNEPAFVAYTADAVAELRGIETSELRAATGRNAVRLFRLQDRANPG